MQHDDQKVKDYGVKLAVEMIHRLTREAKVPGVHFCTLNLEKSVQRVVEGLAWTNVDHAHKTSNQLIAVGIMFTYSVLTFTDSCFLQDISGANTPTFDRQSDLIITPHRAADTVTSNLASNHIPESVTTEAGKGELNHAATWDDFPNGRFGDFKSPAFGDLNPWGTSTISVRVLI